MFWRCKILILPKSIHICPKLINFNNKSFEKIFGGTKFKN